MAHDHKGYSHTYPSLSSFRLLNCSRISYEATYVFTTAEKAGLRTLDDAESPIIVAIPVDTRAARLVSSSSPVLIAGNGQRCVGKCWHHSTQHGRQILVDAQRDVHG